MPKKVELLHPVTHDGRSYSRGVHELPDEVADHFLKNLKCPKTRDRVAKEFVPNSPVSAVGVQAPAPDTDEGRLIDSRVPQEGEKPAPEGKGKKAKSE